MISPSPSPFTEARARALLAQACASAGLRPEAGVRLLALGENAVFELGDPAVVAKVGRAAALTARAARELAVARWLDGAGIPVVRPADAQVEAQRGGVITAEGHPVTFWRRLAPAVRPADSTDLAPLLRALHGLTAPAAPGEPLPRRDLLAPVERWLRAAEGHLDPGDAAFLLARRAELAAAVQGLTPALPPGVIHGDALPRNVHVEQGGPVLLDLENVADDLREHDLVTLALSRDRYGVPEQEYLAFTRAYGWDVRDWEGCAVLRGARETASAAWVAQQVPGNPAALAEFRRRVASLREADAGVRWFAF
ncbi:phosphotransferase enzyme family protein [Kitasatospora kifunensis]|uniref:Ser/Thr protein kinase RdoA (MazF antagonist) n=1 Tax=Kitasatospora kifunensis TaxID=58351 RepID=A0A7W7VTY4_KITKI|nr:aminoglycoside phosphotransferase family protein [Kitasatospora kifunensis]MBB4922737.1 Ser/Thr protein kinase RdoA (MazF antagonist) [Kitasatospora kifunensis]